MRRLLLVVAGVLALAAVALLVAVPIALDRTLSAEALERRASEALGRPVTVERVGIAFTPALRIRAEGVAIEGGGGADVLEVELALLPLLQRRVEPDELHLVRPRLQLHRGADGGLHSGFEFGRRGGTGTGGLPPLPPIDARDGEIVLMEGGAPADAPRLEIRRLELGALREGRMALDLEVAVTPASSHRWSLGRARLRGAIVAGGGAARIEGARIEGAGAVVRNLAIERFAGEIGYASGAVDVKALAFEGYGGSGEATGRLHLGRPARFEGSVRLAGMDAGAIVGDWRGAPLAIPPGRLDAEGELALNLGGADRGTGSGHLALHDGRLPSGSLFRTLLGSLGRLTGRLLSLGGAFAPAPSEVEAMAATWVLRANRLHSDDLEVHTDDYDYRAAGSLGLDRSLDLDGTLQLTSRGVQKLLTSAALPLPAAKPVIPAMPLRIAGTLGEPTFAANLAGLPSAATESLGGLLRGGAGVVGGTLKKGKGVLDKAIGR